MLSSPDEYKDALIQAGFKTSKENVRSEFAMDFFQQVLAKAKLAGGPPSIGLHILMQDSTAEKINNMIDNVQAGLVAPVEIIAQK